MPNKQLLASKYNATHFQERAKEDEFDQLHLTDKFPSLKKNIFISQDLHRFHEQHDEMLDDYEIKYQLEQEVDDFMQSSTSENENENEDEDEDRDYVNENNFNNN